MLDTLWILAATMLVFLMQAGFLCLESGLVRSKNSINVAAKNISDFIVSSTVYWLVGFGIMFGESIEGLFGSSTFFFTEESNYKLTAIFLFQMMFCGTAATLVSGAVAERMSYMGYLVLTLIIALFIYPFVGHWVWAGVLEGVPIGWLEKIGFIDFAGSSVVHSVGGWVALAAILIIGPRTGRFTNGGNDIPGSNLPIAILGCLFIWLGWFGFNGGSTLKLSTDIPGILLNTCLAAFAGALVSTLLKFKTVNYIDVKQIINGVIGGLVAITASCHIVKPVSALFIGLVAGLFVHYGSRYLKFKKIDDAIDVVPVHLFCGIWGTLAVAFFVPFGNPEPSMPFIEQLFVQLIGVLCIGAYSFGVGYGLLSFVNKFYPLRVSEQDELMGLNVAEHNVSTEVYDLLSAMHHQQQRSDFSKGVPVEPFTEVGQIAEKYNLVIDQVNKKNEERDEVLAAFKLSERRKGAILDAAMDCIISINAQGYIESFNPAAERCFGQSAKTILNHNFFKIFVPLEKQKKLLLNLSEGFLLSGSWVLNRRNMTVLRRYDGHTFPAEVVITKSLGQEGGGFDYTLHVRDTSQGEKLQKRLENLAFKDSLTSLYNRSGFLRKLETHLQYYKETSGIVALMFLDLDGFKKVNDVYGHQVGDQLLVEVAQRLKLVIREVDLVGRWGGDEFVIALFGELSEQDLSSKAQEILSVIRRPINVSGQTLHTFTSIGITQLSYGEAEADELIQNSDIAMYQAKNSGRDNYVHYTNKMGEAAQKKSEIESDILGAIENNDLFIEYQPKVACDNNQVVGFEALLRWKHPKYGMVSPADFIPVIESSKLIVNVGEWVLTEVAEQMACWQEEGYQLLPIAVNISGFHLHDPSLIELIKMLLVKYKLNAKSFEIEITESALTGNTEDSIKTMEGLRELDIRLSIDDFGTGYSSLNYLKKLPINILKIDGSFIKECADNPDDSAICIAIISLANSLDLDVIAECVETQEQLNFLIEAGCDIYQGYLFERPVSKDKVEQFLPKRV